MNNLIQYGITAGVILLGIIFLAVIIAKLYVKASKEKAFVRTGLGGTKVVKDGGALVLPMFHETVEVNMNTMKLEVTKSQDDALITLDRMRVDVGAEFYVRVKQEEDAIGMAAQTLGDKTLNTVALKELVEGKFVDALRNVAASMKMTDLHEKRSEFVEKVQSSVTSDLEKNGLELESVSLTKFDQTDMKYFNPNNAFDAEGLTILTKEIETRRKIRNDTKQDTDLLIAQKDLAVAKEQAEVKKAQEFVKLQTEQEIEMKKAEQTTEIAKRNAEKNQESELAQVQAAREIEKAKLEKDKTIRTTEIEIQKDVEQKNIEKDKVLKQAEIVRAKELSLAEQDKLIIIAKKSEEQAAAMAAAETAKANEVKARQEVVTIEAVAQAERKQKVEVIEAQTLAQKETAKIVVEAEAEALAADKKASAIVKEAEAKKQASMLEADGKEKAYTVQAAGEKAINDAKNALTKEQVELQIKLKLLEQLPFIIEQAVKPIEKIDSIKLVDMGSSFGGSSSSLGGTKETSSLPDQLVNATLKHKMVSPLVDRLLTDAGIDLKDLNTTISNLTEKNDPVEPEKNE